MDLKDPRYQKIILLVFFAIGIIYVFVAYDYLPKSGEIDRREVHLLGLKQHIQNARRRVEQSDRGQLEQELHALEEELTMFQEMLPLEEEVPVLLRDVERKGLQSGVSSVLFEPRGTIPSDLFTELTYRVSVRGDYHDIGTFLSRVAGMKRIVAPSDLTLVTNKVRREASEKEDLSVVAEFDMSTYTSSTAPPDTTRKEAGK